MYHSMRVQVQQWRGVTRLSPVDLGWRTVDSNFIPIMPDLPAAPNELLNIIHCGCHTVM